MSRCCSIFLCALFFLIPLSVEAEIGTPQLLIQDKGRTVALDISSLKVSVECEGLYAETLFDVEFFNGTDRRQEGEFVLQLPPGATVSTYALEVNGEMRPGVSVEKDRARNAYESIKRRNVDPGIVEREANNTYRTRIFPIEAGKPKRVQIGFVHRIAGGRYELPLKTDRLMNFSCSVSGTVTSVRLESDQLPLPEKTKAKMVWSAKNLSVNGALVIRSALPTPDKPLIRTDRSSEGTTHFVVQGTIDEVPLSAPAEKWKKVRLIWDTSYSGRFRDHGAELDALDQLWKWIGNCEVFLQFVGQSKVISKSFTVKDGDGSALRERLSDITYDGAINYRLIEPSEATTILVSDGRVSSPSWVPEDDALLNTSLINSTPHPVGAGLKASGIIAADIHHPGWLRYLNVDNGIVEIKGLEKSRTELKIHQGYFTLTGHAPPNQVSPFTIRAPGTDPISVDIPRDKPDAGMWNFSRRLWAQQRLAALEVQGSQSMITTFAMKERLASEFTSLIVLELFSDHLRYRIPPPEPELLKRYHAVLSERQGNVQQMTLSAWRAKTEWHDTEFQWVDAELENEASLVSVWVQSSHKAFPESKINRAALSPFEEWLEQANELIEFDEKLTTGKEFIAWRAQLDRHLEDLIALRTRPAPTPGSDPIHVSIRGFVRERGIYSAEQPYNLVDAIKAAGGPNSFGSLSRVYLYRDAQRTGYNVMSEDRFSVPLRWGDMIVVEAHPQPSFLSGDPFADPFFAEERIPNSGAGGDPVFEQTGSSTTLPPRTSPRGAFGGKKTDGTDSLQGEFDFSSNVIASGKLNKEVIEQLNAADDPVKLYRKLLTGKFGKQPTSVSTSIEVARILFEFGHNDLARQALSNVCELSNAPVESARTYAYWLNELGQSEEAVNHLKLLIQTVDSPSLLALLHSDVGRLSNAPSHFELSVLSASNAEEFDPISTIATTDFFGRSDGAIQVGSLVRQMKPHQTPSDLRIVITTVGDSPSLTLREPSIPSVVTQTGSHKLESSRVLEFQIRRAWPGVYQATLNRWNLDQEGATIHVEIYRNWGTQRQKVSRKTYLMTGSSLDIGEIDFSWEE